MSFETDKKTENFAQLFSRLIEESGMSKRDVALKLDITPSSVTTYTNGTRVPKAVTMYKIADLFHIPYTQLIGLDESFNDQQDHPRLSVPEYSSPANPQPLEDGLKRRQLLALVTEIKPADLDLAIKLLESLRH